MKKDLSNGVGYQGLEKLLDKVFDKERYNPLVRPMDDNKLTTVDIELKLHQIDLVRKMINCVIIVF